MRLATIFFCALVCLRGDTLKEILDRMDSDAVAFKGLTANVQRIEYNAPPLDETQVTDGQITLLKKGKSFIALMDFMAGKDPKQFLFKDNQFHEYLPKVNQINEYDLGKSSSMVNQFVTLGFGSSGKELQRNYTIEPRGSEVLKIVDKDVKVTKLELVPKAAEAAKILKKIEFWIPEGKSYAVKLKIYQPSGNTDTASYSNIQINPPGLNDHSVELKAPKNVRREKINR